MIETIAQIKKYDEFIKLKNEFKEKRGNFLELSLEEERFRKEISKHKIALEKLEQERIEHLDDFSFVDDEGNLTDDFDKRLNEESKNKIKKNALKTKINNLTDEYNFFCWTKYNKEKTNLSIAHKKIVDYLFEKLIEEFLSYKKDHINEINEIYSIALHGSIIEERKKYSARDDKQLFINLLGERIYNLIRKNNRIMEDLDIEKPITHPTPSINIWELKRLEQKYNK